MILCIGLTGLPASGKGTVADILEGWAENLRIACFRYSLSDEIRYCLKKERIPITRESLTQYANSLRKAYGGGVLAQLVVHRMRSETHTAKTSALVLVDAIRNPGEVEVLRDSLGNRFRLIAVRVSEETVRRRLESRRRAGEPSANVQSLLKSEWGIGSPEFGLNIGACTKQADFQIWNDGSEQELRERVLTVAEESFLPLLMREPKVKWDDWKSDCCDR
jgi:dephospho-CoA kinase